MMIITNPPYSGSLHLKILSEAMKHSDDVVNLSPIKWRNPRALFDGNAASSIIKDYSEIFNNLSDLVVIDSETAVDMFGTYDSNDLGIYHITKDGPHKAFSDFINEPLAVKLLKSNVKFLSLVTTVLPTTDEFYRMPTIYGNENKEWLKKIRSPDFERYYKLDKGQKHCRPYVNFKTKEECENFHKYLGLKLPRYLNFKCRFGANVSQDAIPFLPDYTHPWTDQMLYDYFGLTDDEIKTIEKEIK